MTSEQIEQAAKSDVQNKGLVIGSMTAEVYQEGYEDGMRNVLPHQWIPVEERLPEEGQEVLLYDANSVRHYVIGWRRKKGDNKSQWALSNGFVEDKDITHWLSIPKLNPEKEER